VRYETTKTIDLENGEFKKLVDMGTNRIQDFETQSYNICLNPFNGLISQRKPLAPTPNLCPY
jgi:hypothetical protein